MADKEKLFLTPSEVISRIKLPGGRVDLGSFRGLMEYQYGFSRETLDGSMAQLLKEAYWKVISPDYLTVVRSQFSPRFGQVGTVLGSLTDGIATMFGDGVIDRFIEDELLLLEKKSLSAAAGIEARFLDPNWEEVAAAGQLFNYRQNPARPPLGWYQIKMASETRQVEDWGMLTAGEVRFVVKDPASLA
jgi:hypothetical protein